MQKTLMNILFKIKKNQKLKTGSHDRIKKLF